MSNLLIACVSPTCMWYVYKFCSNYSMYTTTPARIPAGVIVLPPNALSVLECDRRKTGPAYVCGAGFVSIAVCLRVTIDAGLGNQSGEPGHIAYWSRGGVAVM